MDIKIEGEVHNSIVGEIKTNSFIQNQYVNIDEENIFDPDRFLFDLIDKSIRLLERKNKSSKIEDLYNDDFTHYLRDMGYIATDQTRTGKALVTVGEVDIMIRKVNGTPISIIEAFRLKYCGADNTIISSHLNKLLHDYDSAGLKRNFVLVYAEAKNYKELWNKYILYINDLNSKKGFLAKNKLKSFVDTIDQYCKVTDIRVGKAVHEREGIEVEVFHLFINMTF